MRGFTLTEMLVVMIILSIVSVISFTLLGHLMKISGSGLGGVEYFAESDDFYLEALEVKKILSNFLNRFSKFENVTDELIEGNIKYPNSYDDSTVNATVSFIDGKLCLTWDIPNEGLISREIELNHIEAVVFYSPTTPSTIVEIVFEGNGESIEFTIGSEL